VTDIVQIVRGWAGACRDLANKQAGTLPASSMLGQDIDAAHSLWQAATLTAAADELERRQAEIERLQEALQFSATKRASPSAAELAAEWGAALREQSGTDSAMDKKKPAG
jgi:hypothetical protein